MRLTPVDVVNLGGHVVLLELGGVRLSPLPKHRHGFEMFFGLMNNAVSFVRFASRRGCEMLGLQCQRRGDAGFLFCTAFVTFFRLETARFLFGIHLWPCWVLAVA